LNHTKTNEALGLIRMSPDVLKRDRAFIEAAEQFFGGDTMAIHRKKGDFEEVSSTGLTQVERDVLHAV
jgi:hypothetical protein